MMLFLRSGIFKIFFLQFFLFAVVSTESSFAQVKFSAVCPAKEIGKNEIVQIQFKVENAAHVESIIPPAFKDFKVVSGPSQESGMTSINGKVNQYIALTFSLQPKSTGKLTIGSATARADGKEYTSAPVTIEVTKASNSPRNNNSANSLSPFANFNFDFPVAPARHQFDDYILKPGEKIEDKVQKNIFIKLDVDKTGCFVGEPVTASYKLYTRLRSETTITEAPSFNGFSVSDLAVNDNNVSIEKYNGRPYNVYTLRKVQLYPLQPGNITLDPLVSDNKVTFIKSEYANSQSGDRFYDMLENFADATAPGNAVIERNVSLKSKPVTITVKPLPVENIPAGFKGAVGKFSIQSSLEKNRITTDDAGNLKVTITGQGNIQLINAPKIKWPEGIDGYDAKVKDDVDKTLVPMTGTKTFIYPFTVTAAGNYKIDSISFSFFDPASSSYKIIRTPPLEVYVTKGSGANNSYAGSSPIATPVRHSFFTRQPFVIIAGIVVFIAIILIIFFLNNKKNKSREVLEKNIRHDEMENGSPGNEPEFVIPENTLLPAHEKLIQQDSAGFYNVLHASLHKYLAAKFKMPEQELTKKRMNEELDRCNVGIGTSNMLNSLIEEIELNLYAPPSTVNHLRNVFEKASEVVSLLDKQICK